MIFKPFSFLHLENEEQVELSDLIGSLSNTNENGILKKKLVSKYTRSIKHMLDWHTCVVHRSSPPTPLIDKWFVREYDSVRNNIIDTFDSKWFDLLTQISWLKF